ncbi:hypothetical protein KL948_004810 [Ogataea haglerorum]|nr:hypothetical protein KL948_004810 [Ogataea haglerorum]
MNQPAAYDYSQRRYLSRFVPTSRLGMLLIVVAVAVVEPATTGMESAIMGSINSLPQYKAYFSLTSTNIGLNSASKRIGSILSLPFLQKTSDGIGRRMTILCAIVLMVIGIAISAASVNMAMFIIGRIFLGLAAGLINCSASVLVAEICPLEIRGWVLGLFHSCYYIGSLIASGVTYGSRDLQSNWSWRIPTIIQVVPSLTCASLVLFTPESPRWLVMKGRVDEAREIFYTLQRNDAGSADFMVAEVERSLREEAAASKGYGVWRRQLHSRAYWKRAFIMLNIGLLCELGGSNIATYYFTILLEQIGVKDAKTQLKVNMVRSAWCLVCALIGCYTFDIIGRKRQAFLATTGLIECLFILGGLIKKYGGSDDKSGGYAAIAMVFMFTGFYSYCYTPITSVYPPELYPSPTRVVGNTIMRGCDYSAGLFATFMLPIGMSNLGWKFYMLTGGYDIIFLPLIAFVWVETNGVPLEKICELFGEVSETESPSIDDESNINYVEVPVADKQ